MAPGGMAGSGASGLTAVKVGLESLQKALGSLPMGSPLHSAVIKALGDISKHMSEAGEGAGGGTPAMIQQLIQMARGASAQPQEAAMQKMFPGGAPGGAPPPPPPMGA
jgi:hypothetical protein